MERILYHGSNRILKAPSPKGGKPYNDYGYGFYCTQEQDMAREWAARENGRGYVNCYHMKEDRLRILTLMEKPYCILHWLTILLENRTFEILSPLAEEGYRFLQENYSLPYRSYDVLIGYRADDSYFSFAQDFLNGTISYRQLANAMYLGKLGEQYVLISKDAFAALSFDRYEIVDDPKWFLSRQTRDRQARKAYFSKEKNRRKKGDLFITHFLDEEIRSDDPRLRLTLP